jgi:SAM-dependent methyltransferase
VISSPEKFADDIAQFTGQFDAVISSHNLEHCNQPEKVLRNMCTALKRHGKIYIAFSCAESASFPKRRGALNFYDDATHVNLLNFHIKLLKSSDRKALSSILPPEGIALLFRLSSGSCWNRSASSRSGICPTEPRGPSMDLRL